MTIAGALIAMLVALVLRQVADTATMPRLVAMQEIPMTVLDAAGLSLFAVAGLQKALVRGIGPLGAVLMGTLTAVGGGVVRDVLLAQVPVILRTDFYATAAIIGCVAILLGRRCGLSMQWASVLGGFVCFAARTVGAFNHWHLPVFV